MTTHVRSYMY